MKNATHITIGAPETWGALHIIHPKLGRVPGKQFLQEPLGATGMEISVNAFPAGRVFPLRHHHVKNEEVFLFLSGAGEFEVDGDVFAIGPGSVVRVAPEGVRGFRNTGDTTLTYVCIQARADSGVGPGTVDAQGDGPPLW